MSVTIQQRRQFQWSGIRDSSIQPELRIALDRHIETVLQSWEGTPYQAGCRCKGRDGAVDCVRFGTGVYDELYGYPRTAISRLPPDLALHNKRSAMAAMRLIRRLYMPNMIVTDGSIEPGDAIVTGEIGGGPGHLMIAGLRPNTLWEANRGGVRYTGISNSQTIYRIYRQTDRHKWLLSLH